MKFQTKNNLLFIIVLLALAIFPISINAQDIGQQSQYDYVINRYDVNIIVNENNTFDITEKITAYFNKPKHGIYRTLPLSNEVKRLDGTTSVNRAKISDIILDHEYTTSIEDGSYKLQIGSADKTLTGEETYTIKYHYNIGKDPVKDYDELYYNIIGDGWDTVINNVHFEIQMPKEFDTTKLGFSAGKSGSTNSSNIYYTVDNNVITGNYQGILYPNEALTVRCQLDEGYFVGAGFKTNPIAYIMFIIPILFLAISIWIWYKYGRDNQVVETVEFYPPEGFNSLEVGFLYNGKAKSKDVVSLLIYLANKGYIKISETENKSMFSTTKGFKITKLKEYDGDNINEKLFLEGLKKPVDYYYTKKSVDNNEESNEVTDLDLKYHFYITVHEILSNMNNKENKNKIYEEKASKKSIGVILLMILSLLTTVIVPTVEYANIGGFGIGLGILITLFAFGVYSFFIGVLIFGNAPLKISIIIIPFILIHAYFMIGTLPFGYAIKNDPVYLSGTIVGIVCLVGIMFCLKYLPKRTKYGNDMLGKIRGFKNYLETAEKDKLEAMVMENPTYFYDILPYTYVLEVSDKWIKKFETITTQPPSWYDSPNSFNMINFGSFIDSTMTSAQSSMTSSPPSSSDSSGGGSSGGGSGGGGGGSW